MSVSMLRTTTALVASVGLLLAGLAGATEAKAKKAAQKEMTFEGDVIAVDVPAKEFTVRNTARGVVSEMKFHVGQPASITIDGEIGLLNDLQGEHVTVTYETDGSTHLAKHLHRREKTT